MILKGVPGLVVTKRQKKYGRRRLVPLFKFDDHGYAEISEKRFSPTDLSKLKIRFKVVDKIDLEAEVEKPKSVTTFTDNSEETVEETVENIEEETIEETEEEMVEVVETTEEVIEETEDTVEVVEEVKEEIIEETVEETINYKDKNLTELKEIGKSQGLKCSNWNKEKLITALEV